MSEVLAKVGEAVPQSIAAESGNLNVPEQLILCKYGTAFSVADGMVTVTRSDQPICVIPVGDLMEFCERRMVA